VAEASLAVAWRCVLFFDGDGCAVDLGGCDRNGDADGNMVKVGTSLEADCQTEVHYYR